MIIMWAVVHGNGVAMETIQRPISVRSFNFIPLVHQRGVRGREAAKLAQDAKAKYRGGHGDGTTAAADAAAGSSDKKSCCCWKW